MLLSPSVQIRTVPTRVTVIGIPSGTQRRSQWSRRIGGAQGAGLGSLEPRDWSDGTERGAGGGPGGRWPRWTNGSRLFTVSGRWLDNNGVVYGEARVALLLNPGSLEPIGVPYTTGAVNDADQGALPPQPWYEQERWMRGVAMNKWSLREGRLCQPADSGGRGHRAAGKPLVPEHFLQWRGAGWLLGTGARQDTV
jgi:hypothetical protein